MKKSISEFSVRSPDPYGTPIPFDVIKQLSVGDSVVVKMKNGQVMSGVLTDMHDWLVGCPVVTLENQQTVGVYYECDIIGINRGDDK